jgi:ABC-type branched-subunit amino acid transport system ATPase component
MFQAVHLFDSMTVGENVLVGADGHDRLMLVRTVLRSAGHRLREREAMERARKALALLQLEDVAEEAAASLPFGKQRLVAVARAIAAEPRLLLLDEPAAGLSEPEIESLALAVQRVQATGVTVLLVEHNVGFVMRLCEHVVVMHGGRKIADGSPAEIQASAAVQEAYLGA